MAGSVQRMFPASGVDAAKIQGEGVSIKDPSPGQGLVWDDYTKQWIPYQAAPVYSETAPANPVQGTRWVDTSTLKEYIYYSGAWVEVGSALAIVPPASETVSGTVELATNAEVQTGTDAVRAVVPSALAAWWTWLKTQAQTFAGNLTLNGTSNTAPNQTTASGSSLMTRDLGDVRYGRKTYFAKASSNTDVSASTTYVTVLTLADVETGEYEIDLLPNVNPFAGSGGAKIQIIGGTATIAGGRGFAVTNASALAASTNIAASLGYTWTGFQAILRRTGNITVSVAGTVLVQFAQNAPDATATRFLAGSYVRMTRLD